MKWNLPNILTLLRLLAAPGVAVMFLYFARPYADWVALILFSGAAITDFIDGYLARAWKQETKFGAMLDPIADKAMVVIALLVITGFSGMNPWILLPATVIIFREIFVSGLREYLGDKAALLKVTQIAKLKTTVQMVAIAFLFAAGMFGQDFIDRIQNMDESMVEAVLNGEAEDFVHLRWYQGAAWWTWWIGVTTLWISAALTLISGIDYFRKSLPMLREA